MKEKSRRVLLPYQPGRKEAALPRFEENEEYEDDHLDDIMMCVCVDYDENGGALKSGAAYGNNAPSMPIGDPPVISCDLLIRFVDDALNMARSNPQLCSSLSCGDGWQHNLDRSLQCVTVG